MRQRIWQVAIAFVVLALVAAACGDGEEAQPEEREAAGEEETEPAGEPEEEPGGEPIRIGASLPLTGQFSVPGSKHGDGYQFCVDLLNERGGLLDRPVELLVSDNRSDTETAVSQYERFIDVDNVDLLFGTFSSLLTFPTSAAAEQAGMVYPIPSGGALQIWERGFEHLFYFQQTAAEFIGSAPVNALVHYRDEGAISEDDFPTTAAVVHADDFFANAIVNGLVGAEVEIAGADETVDLSPGFLAEAGIEVAFQQQWPEGFGDWLTLANSVKGSNADLLLAGTASPDEAVQLVRALQTVDYNPKAIYMSQGTQVEFLENLGDAADGVMAHSSWHAAADFEGELAGEAFTNQDFIDAFTERFDRAPDEDEAIPFAVCQGIEQAVRGAGSTDNAAVRDWLADRTPDDPVRTVMGDYSWDERGLPDERDHVMTQWQGETLELIFPVGEFPGVADLVYPKPEW